MTVRVLGLGNALMSDEGFGSCVVEHLLAMYRFPDGVEVIDVGTPGLDLMPFVSRAQALVLVDAVRLEGSPGELRTFRAPEILALPSELPLGSHDPDLKDVLLAADRAGIGAREILLVGAIPADLAPGSRLTLPVQAAVPRAARLVVDELARLGVPPRPRDAAGAPLPWWTFEPGGSLAT